MNQDPFQYPTPYQYPPQYPPTQYQYPPAQYPPAPYYPPPQYPAQYPPPQPPVHIYVQGGGGGSNPVADFVLSLVVGLGILVLLIAAMGWLL